MANPGGDRKYSSWPGIIGIEPLRRALCMNEDEKQFLSVGMEVALRPVTQIAEDVLGRLGGDWLHETRQRNRERLRQKTDEILRKRKVEPKEPVSPTIIMPLLAEAQDESRDELLNLWAKLIAATMDPSRVRSFRREFITIVKQLEPLDVIVLPQLVGNHEMRPSRREHVAPTLEVSENEVELAFRNLMKLELAGPEAIRAPHHHPFTTALGQELLRLVAD